MGELLTDAVPLSPLDVEEVLAEQLRTEKPFGHVALELGLCTPQHVWRAWVAQLADGEREVDLDRVGIDAQALSALPPSLAIEYSVIPLRLVDDTLVLATTAEQLPLAKRELPERLGRPVRFALASAEDISRAIQVCYLPLIADC
jgi:hypothetical protein